MNPDDMQTQYRSLLMALAREIVSMEGLDPKNKVNLRLRKHLARNTRALKHFWNTANPYEIAATFTPNNTPHL